MNVRTLQKLTEGVRGPWYSLTNAIENSQKVFKQNPSFSALDAYNEVLSAAERYIADKNRQDKGQIHVVETSLRRAYIEEQRGLIAHAECQLLLMVVQCQARAYHQAHDSMQLNSWKIALDAASEFQTIHFQSLQQTEQSAIALGLSSSQTFQSAANLYHHEKAMYDQEHALSTKVSQGLVKINQASFWCCCRPQADDRDQQDERLYEELITPEELAARERKAHVKEQTNALRIKYGRPGLA
jgi:hypothetical protein